jgi:hypothetical protein
MVPGKISTTRRALHKRCSHAGYVKSSMLSFVSLGKVLQNSFSKFGQHDKRTLLGLGETPGLCCLRFRRNFLKPKLNV